MVIRQNSQRISTRPFVVAMVILAVLALALAAGSLLKTSPAAHVTRAAAAAAVTTSMSPDAQERNAQTLQLKYAQSSSAKGPKHS